MQSTTERIENLPIRKLTDANSHRCCAERAHLIDKMTTKQEDARNISFKLVPKMVTQQSRYSECVIRALGKTTVSFLPLICFFFRGSRTVSRFFEIPATISLLIERW
jgi:hypothetical protein